MIYVDEKGIDEIIRELQLLSPRTRRAANKAVRKTVTWAYNSIIKRGAAAADVKQTSLRRGIRRPSGKRVYRRDINARKLQGEASVYTGYNPLKSHYVGAIPKWKRGQTPRIRSHKFPGAFVLQFSNSYRGIFKRDPRTKKLVEQTVDMEPVNKVIRQVRAQSAQYLKGVLANELQVELNRRGNR